MKIAVIPARGGSKRIPRKNIRNFAGRPIISYSIQAALQCELFDHVIVSTDDEEIAQAARSCGASVPFMRPARLADDFTGTGEVTNHAVQWLEATGCDIEHVCCIYPTAPFITANDLVDGWEALSSSDCDYVFSVTQFSYPVQRALRMNDGGLMEIVSEHDFQKRSQDLEPYYHDAGMLYWSNRDALGKRGFSGNMRPLILPSWRVHDIDTEEDWRRAELVHLAMQLKTI